MNRLAFASSFALAATLTASAQTNTFPASGNVGIGTSSPWTPLQIVGPFTPGGTQLMVQSSGSDDRQGVAFYNIAGQRTGIIYNGLQDGFILGREQAGLFRFFSGGAERLTIASGGNVGIGTPSPDHRLHITSPNNHGVMIETPNQGPWAFRIRNTSAPNRGLEIFQDDSGTSQLWNNYNGGSGTLIAMNSSGNVGIGTTNPQHKLAVNGTIKAKEVIVETTGWSDYVFADNYALQPLAEVEAHIKINKHLPGIPSAAQVAEQGVSVGDMQARLLAKIEELTLHQIAQEKELASLRQEVRALRASR